MEGCRLGASSLPGLSVREAPDLDVLSSGLRGCTEGKLAQGEKGHIEFFFL